MDRVVASGRFVVVVNELDIVLGNVMLRRLWMEKNFLFQGTKGSKHYQREQVDILLEDSILESIQPEYYKIDQLNLDPSWHMLKW